MRLGGSMVAADVTYQKSLSGLPDDAAREGQQHRRRVQELSSRTDTQLTEQHRLKAVETEAAEEAGRNLLGGTLLRQISSLMRELATISEFGIPNG
jgi:hypothetical protein